MSKILYSLSLLSEKHRRKIIFFALARTLLGILDILGILLMGLLLSRTANSFSANSNLNNFKFLNNFSIGQIAFFAVLIFVSKSLLSAIFMRLMVNTLAAAESDIASKLFTKLIKSDLTMIQKRSKQETIYPLNQALGLGITEILTLAVTIVSETALLLAIVIAFLFIDFKITFFIFIYFFIIGYVIQMVVGKSFQSAGNKYASSIIESSSVVEDGMNSFREIKTSKSEAYFIALFSSSRKKAADSLATIQFVSALPRYIVESALMIGAIGLAAISFSGGNITEAAQNLGIFLTGGLRIMASMLPLQNALGAAKQLLAKSEKFYEFENDLKVVNLSDEKSSIRTIQTPIAVQFKDSSFIYPQSEKFVIRNFNLDIRPGELVALIGPSGSGKSTLADLIMGISNLTSGTLIYKDSTGKNLDVEEIPMSYVSQNPGLIRGSIIQNIAFGKMESEIDFNWLNECVSFANLQDLIGELPNGLNSDLGKESNALSGGQLQRIGLARALYAKPRLLVLDEATSALDPETEASITEVIEKLRGSCTTLVIAHRLATIRDCDTVHVLNDGQIIGSGNFNDLVATNDLVAKYVKLSELN